jgi:hypothetical protein
MMFSFRVVTLCGLVGEYQRFEEAYCLHLQFRSNDFSLMIQVSPLLVLGDLSVLHPLCRHTNEVLILIRSSIVVDAS